MNTAKADPDVVALMRELLLDKSQTCDDISSISNARKELKRIRNIMQTYKQNDVKKGLRMASMIHKKKARIAIREEEHINDYVKKAIPKDETIRNMLYDAMKKNVLFESNTQGELRELIDVFELVNYESLDIVINQGEKGDDFFVVGSGELSIHVRMTTEEDDENLADKSINVVKVGTYHEGTSFGELALIYGSPRAATITAISDCKLWRIKRGWYRGVVGQHRKRLHMEKVKFLPKVNVGKELFGDILKPGQLDTMAQLLTQEYFKEGDTILREGEAGNTFYLIQSGEVDVFRRDLGDKAIARLGTEKFFGEKALLEDDVRQATVVAASSTVVCYVMSRGDFTRVLGDLRGILDGRTVQRASMLERRPSKLPMKKVTYKLKDLITLNLLGEGAFGKVKLVKAADTGECYALKAQGKDFIVKNSQKKYIMNELALMKKLTHPNILVMHCAMQDKKYIYFLLELLPGGELMNILEAKKHFPEHWVRFYSASVVLAFKEFHNHNIAYRDLKPENMVLDAKGYCVVVDLGLAKQLEDGPTYTFCGTPDYIAPELILGTGYNWAVDYWALGILLYELHCGSAPFQSYDPTGTAKKILKGRVKFPSKFSSQLAGVIKELLTKDPTRRLGCMSDGAEGVVHHRFYHGFDWQGLLDKEIDVPYAPRIPKRIETIGRVDHETDIAKSSKWSPSLD